MTLTLNNMYQYMCMLKLLCVLNVIVFVCEHCLLIVTRRTVEPRIAGSAFRPVGDSVKPNKQGLSLSLSLICFIDFVLTLLSDSDKRDPKGLLIVGSLGVLLNRLKTVWIPKSKVVSLFPSLPPPLCLSLSLCQLNIVLLILSRVYNREGEYPTPVYHSVVSLDRGRDLYNVIHTCGISLFVQSNCNVASQGACVAVRLYKQ